MPSDTLNFHIAAIGPSDVQAELKLIEPAVAKLSKEFLHRNVTLSFHHWSHLAPGLGNPQGYIDKTINWGKMDFVIGAMWRKFGSPVDDADSGTEHECNEIIKLSAGGQPDLLFYFRDDDGPETVEKQKLTDFRRSLYRKALVGTYTSKRDFVEQVEVAIRNKIELQLSSQNQTQRRMGRLPANKTFSVELIVFSEIPDRGQTPAIIILRDGKGRYFFLDTRYVTGQELANWIAQAMGFAITEGMQLMDYLMEVNLENIKKNTGLLQLWLGNVIYADHPGLKIKELKIALGTTNMHDGKLGWDMSKGSDTKIEIKLPPPSLTINPDGTKRIIM